jgi:hypothetical protein
MSPIYRLRRDPAREFILFVSMVCHVRYANAQPALVQFKLSDRLPCIDGNSQTLDMQKWFPHKLGTVEICPASALIIR